MVSAVVFLGPSLSRHEAERESDALFLPPARQGDLFHAARTYRPVAIGLIDGAFLDVPSVWHREILWALSEGVHVFGGASMGALRAAELDRFGMRGVGRIYEAYRDGKWPGYDEPFEDDDEVAVIHAPAPAGSVAFSDAMVDLRETLLTAEAAGLLTRAQRDTLSARMKCLHFSERSFTRLADAAPEILGNDGTRAFAGWLRTGRVARKRLDALAMLRALTAFLRERPAPFRADFRFERALVWERWTASVQDGDPDTEEGSAVLEELRLQPDAWRMCERAVTGRLDASVSAPETVSDAELRRQLDCFRRARGLWQREQLTAWLAENALDEAGLAALLRHEAALARAAREKPPGFRAALLDHLRLTGGFAALHRRAQAKRTALAPIKAARRPPDVPLLDAALDWYFETRLGRPRPRSLNAHLGEQGWPSAAAWETAVWREYLYMTQTDPTAAEAAGEGER